MCYVSMLLFLNLVCFRLFCVCLELVVFFFKQKTAYEMRISDWSSDVCSSDLNTEAALAKDLGTRFEQDIPEAARSLFGEELRASFDDDDKIGRASCRERVCQYV